MGGPALKDAIFDLRLSGQILRGVDWELPLFVPEEYDQRPRVHGHKEQSEEPERSF